VFGILNIDKPAGISSREAVNRVQRLVRPAKVGHAGTLDPLATGVLVVCLGQATRLIQRVQQMPKRYVGNFLLGRRSPTEDTEGEIELLLDPPRPTSDEIIAATRQFVGAIAQRPPAHSALKVAGRRAYKRARAGEQLDLPARTVHIHQIELVRYEYPELTLDIQCGSGTYIRSLGRDLGEALGTAAVMCDLRRTAIGPFRVQDACNADSLSLEAIERHLIPAQAALPEVPQLAVTEQQRERIARGMAIPQVPDVGSGETAAIDPSGRLIALLTPSEPGWLRPTRVFMSE